EYRMPISCKYFHNFCRKFDFTKLRQRIKNILFFIRANEIVGIKYYYVRLFVLLYSLYLVKRNERYDVSVSHRLIKSKVEWQLNSETIFCSRYISGKNY